MAILATSTPAQLPARGPHLPQMGPVGPTGASGARKGQGPPFAPVGPWRDHGRAGRRRASTTRLSQTEIDGTVFEGHKAKAAPARTRAASTREPEEPPAQASATTPACTPAPSMRTCPRVKDASECGNSAHEGHDLSASMEGSNRGALISLDEHSRLREPEGDQDQRGYPPMWKQRFICEFMIWASKT